MPKRTLALAVVLALAGCAATTQTAKPEFDLPQSWSATEPQGQQLRLGQNWWTLYGDPRLNRLVEEALAHNADLEAAIARVDEARALEGIARADQFPEVSAGLSRARTRSSQVGGTPLPAGMPATGDSHRATLNIAYEVDLWGRYRSASRAARAELLASAAARDTVRLTVAAQVVQGYFTLTALDEQVAIARRTLETRREALALQRKRFDAGAISELDLRQVEAEAAAVEASLPGLETRRAQQEHALAVLLGRSPRQVVEAAVERSPDGGAAPAVWVPEGLPSELLLRRPDLRAAEHRLAAADARVDAARAGYFPSIALTGYLGSESARLSNLFSGPAGIWQFAATLLQPIFNAGRTSAEVEAAAARERQLIAAYRGAVANAFREVKDALVAQSRAREALEAETRRAEALQKATALARLRYDNGIASQLDVLDAERSLLQARLNRAEALRAHRVAVADLVRALGGGWSESPPEPMAAR